MRERRWESQGFIHFDEVAVLARRLKERGLDVKDFRREAACYIEEFRIARLDEIDRLGAWNIDELTLVQINDRWEGDFFILAGKHHDLYRQHPRMEGYLSLSHPWRIPDALNLRLHQPESMFWIGFRDTHGFIRVRVIPGEIITPGERRGEGRRLAWMTERASAFSEAIQALDLPLFVEWEKGSLTISPEEETSAVSLSWPDAFGPCQFEYIVSDRYELLVPAARFISKVGSRPAVIRTFLSGFPKEILEEFHSLQPESKMLYRGYIHAPLNDLPEVVQAMVPSGRALVNLSEFGTGTLLPQGEESYAVVGVIGSESGFKIEIRLNRAPLPEAEMEEWLNDLIGLPMGYAPLALY
ncbi:MAG TPA: hypothetical protein VFA47_13335 [Candidatus Manganitrophaceae bacterium]|nr:hypothetical protein [Candidatus Manganitrophaceae bacterium]